MYSQDPLLFWRDRRNNFPTLQVLWFVSQNVGRFRGSGEPLLCYRTNMQQLAIKLITSNTAQVNFPARQPGLYHRAVINFRVIESVA